ncbi:UNVERIFIED_CONTAM: hypothetical protein FKN15_058218 [Acipenser sinensis]
MAHTCRGTINLAMAHIDTEDSCNIVLTSGGRSYHLKASSEVERQRWVTALELAKAKAIGMMHEQSVLQEGAAVIQQPPVSHGRDTGRSALLDAPTLLDEREREPAERNETKNGTRNE